MNVLVFGWKCPLHRYAGGAERFGHEVFRRWVADGHRVTLFTAGHRGLDQRSTADGVEVVRCGGRFSVYREARRFYEREGRGHFDLVVDVINTRPFLTPRFVTDVPVVAIAYQVARELWNEEFPWAIAQIGRRWLEPSWLRAYRDVLTVTISEASRVSLIEYGLNRVTVIPVGLEPIVDRRPPLKEQRPTAIFVGRLAQGKRPQQAIRAFEIARAQAPSAQLWIVGTGPLDGRLRRQAPTGVQFFGGVDDKTKLDLMSRAHVLIATSVREGWGMVVSEAASVGTPALTYDVPGLRESVTAAGGTLTPPSPEALGRELGRWLANGGMPVPNPLAGCKPWEDVARAVLETVEGATHAARY